MRYETLLYAVADDVATVTLNRPDRMNSLHAVMRGELLDALTRAPRAARAVVLTGAGRGVCAGPDLGDTGRSAGLHPAPVPCGGCDLSGGELGRWLEGGFAKT